MKMRSAAAKRRPPEKTMRRQGDGAERPAHGASPHLKAPSAASCRRGRNSRPCRSVRRAAAVRRIPGRRPADRSACPPPWRRPAPLAISGTVGDAHRTAVADIACEDAARHLRQAGQFARPAGQHEAPSADIHHAGGLHAVANGGRGFPRRADARCGSAWRG